MVNLDELIKATTEAASAHLPKGVHVERLPPDSDGDKFQLVYIGEAWRAVLTISLGWRSLSLSYIPQGFGIELVRYAEHILSNQDFGEVLESIGFYPLHGIVDIRCDGEILPLTDRSKWHSGWRNLEVHAKFLPFEARGANKDPDIDQVMPRISSFLKLVAALLPPIALRNEVFLEDRLQGVPEGSRTRVEVNRYERDPVNRQACIDAQGASCSVCSMDFETRYGLIGRGFIHVHHLVPLAHVAEEHPIDPKKDLAPVCANCHAMLHRRTPPFTIAELRDQLR